MKPLAKQIILFDSSNLDPRANAFLIATGLVNDTTIAPAINTFVLDINTIYNKFYAIYPLVGGTATTHKYNLINPLDTNAAYRLVFAGGITHNSNGITFNGINGTCDTFLLANTPPINSVSLSVYSRTSGNSSGADIGLNAAVASPRLNLIIQYTGGNTYFDANNTYLGTGAALATTATGLYTSSRTASNIIKLFRRGAIASSKTNASTTQNTTSINFGGLSGGGYTSRNNCFYAIAQGLSDAEATTLNNAVQKLQTALSRQAY